jgi:hypothetical protein
MEDTEGDIDDMEEFDELEEMEIIQAEVDADMAAWRQSTLLQMQEEEDMRVALSNSLVTAREEAGHRAAYMAHEKESEELTNAQEKDEIEEYARMLEGYLDADSDSSDKGDRKGKRVAVGECSKSKGK